MITRGKGGRGKWKIVKGGRTVNGRRLGVVNTIQYTDDAFYNYMPETYIILLPNVTPINSIR